MAFAFPRVTIRSGMVTVLLLALLTVALTSTSFAQGTLGSIAGTVRDASGAVVPGATLTLKNVDTGKTVTVTSTGEGAFTFSQLTNGKYTVTVEKAGFRKATYNDVNVLPAQQYSLSVSMQVGASSETVEVTAGQDLVNTTSSEITATVEQDQILKLPLLGRNPIELIRNQAGVAGILAATRNQTAINGGRPGWTQLTQDGINIQDNFIRNNALDFVPNRPTSDTIGEFTIITNNPGADSTGGTSQVKLVTPAGTNNYHGSLYEYNRNSALAAMSWFTKRNRVLFNNPSLTKPFLNQNQFGGKIGGPVLKNKLFFFGSYEGYRNRSQQLQRLIVPLNPDYLTGVYRYKRNVTPVDPNTYTVNVLNLINQKNPTSPLSINSVVQNEVLSKLRTPNSTDCGDLLNTGCYAFNQSAFTDRDQYAFRGDYNVTDKHSIEFVFQKFHDNASRNDVDNINPVPKATLSTDTKLFVGAWRWTVTPTFINEFRAGDNSSVVPFLSNQPIPNYFYGPGSTGNNAPTLTGLNVTAPNYYFLDQGRRVTTRAYVDNATWSKGAHNMAFGMSYNNIQPHTYNFANVIPTVTFGFSNLTANNKYNLVGGDFAAGTAPGTSDLGLINSYGAFLSGYITQLAQTYQVKDTTTGFVFKEPNHRRYTYSIWAPYFQDSWRFRPNLTITAGLKWEYWTPLTESDGIGLLPVIKNGDTKASLLDPNGTVAPIGTFWHPDKMQFAPNVGFAWDPFSDGKTSIRGGYSMSYVNEDLVTAANNALNGNFGLVGAVTAIQQTGVLGTANVNIPVPNFNPNRTYAQQLQNSPNGGGPTAAAFAIQQDLRTPYAHQLNLEIQREVGWETAIYARYVGTLGRDLWRGIDYNQQVSTGNQAYYADFLRARNNYYNCPLVNGQRNPSGAGCAGAQPLQWFPTFDLGGLLGNSLVQNFIATGEVGGLADLYVQNRASFPSAPGIFSPNLNIYAADAVINGAELNYHAMQLEARRRMKSGLGFQINYTFSKNLADSAGNTQARFEPFLDNNNRHLDYGRSEFDLTHAVNSNFIYELPFGKGKRWASAPNGFVDRVIGGWSMSSIIRWQSGNPFSILAPRGTINRPGRAAGMPAYSTLTPDQIKGLLGLFENTVNHNLYWINPSVIASNGRAVGSSEVLSYSPTFTGQAFYNPLPGEAGNLKRLQFDGPASYSWDFSAAKQTKITEGINTEFRVDFFNFLNSGQLALFGDYNVNSSTFGRLTSALPARVIQASLRVNF